MDNREIAIRLSGVKKRYKLGQIGGGTLQGDLQSWWARVRGKEDPNTKIGTDQRLLGQTFYALNGIDLTVYKGEALGIIGSNGAGKSTMLKLLSRVTAPTEGEIDLYGRITSMLEVGTGFNGEMTGRENIYMNGAILGMTRAEIDAKMEDIIEFSEVRDFIDTPVKRYSSGMYVKLAFSVAAHLDSEILIMDEVLAVGDMAFQKKCLDKMRDAAKKEGRTVLYVSHNMNTIRQLCDRCVVLDQGKVVFEGDVEEAIMRYTGCKLENNTSMNFEDWKRPGWITNQRILLKEMTFLEKDTNIFDLDESINVQLVWKNLYKIDSLCVRLEIVAADDIVAGTYMLFDFYHGEKDSDGTITLNLDISSLSEDSYQIKVNFFNSDRYGNISDIDFVRGLWFTKKSVNIQSNIMWSNKNWGHVQFPTPQILICQ